MATYFGTVVINRNRLLRYLLRAISKYNIYEKQIHQSSGKSNYELDILKGVVINLLEITKSVNRRWRFGTLYSLFLPIIVLFTSYF